MGIERPLSGSVVTGVITAVHAGFAKHWAEVMIQ